MALKLSGKRILVTGADGFIGSHLTELLVRAGAHVRALAQYNSFNSFGWLDELGSEVRGQFETVAGDIRDAGFVHEIVARQDIVLHLAALIAIPFSYRSPASYVDTNVMGTLNVLQAVREHGVGRLVCTSTSEVYGTARRVPIDENHPLTAQSPYAATKIAADQLALSFHRSFQTPVLVLRPFNAFGPRQSARAVIPTIIAQIESGSREIKLGSLNPTRDFSYVSDTVGGFVLAAACENGLGEVVNIGSGFEISIGDVARLIAEIAGAEVTILAANDRVRPANSEVERLVADSTKAQKILNWAPHYHGREGLRRGLEETIAWFRKPQNLNRYKPELYNI